jgi:hypothetical protein
MFPEVELGTADAGKFHFCDDVIRGIGILPNHGVRAFLQGES